jgi:hypothetical protein
MSSEGIVLAFVVAGGVALVTTIGLKLWPRKTSEPTRPSQKLFRLFRRAGGVDD